MAILIPSYSTCLPRMTVAERRFARCLESKLGDDFLCWHKLPLGASRARVDFVILHPRRGLMLLQVWDGKPEQVQSPGGRTAPLFRDAAAPLPAPLEQARRDALALVAELERDPRLTFTSGKLQGRLRFPWTHGVVLANLPRRVFANSVLAEALEPQQVICQDEFHENLVDENGTGNSDTHATVSAATFQQSLWNMFPVGSFGHLSPAQIDRIRGHLHPDIRLPAESLDARPGMAPADGGEPMRVLDPEQERVFRDLGNGRQAIHGVAGSGKTLLLVMRAELLARSRAKPILVLCHNKALARRLDHWMHALGVAGQVHIGTFHAWCHRLLTNHQVGLPAGDASVPGYGDALVQRVNQGLERRLIPIGLYEAVLIDEAQDFQPEWLRLAARMADPLANDLLLLYDEKLHNDKPALAAPEDMDHDDPNVLRRNYRNTREIQEFATGFVRQALAGLGADGETLPAPIPVERHGERPSLVRLPTLRDEASHLAQQLKAAHRAGTPWRDMAVLYRHWDPVGKTINGTFRLAGIPLTWKDSLRFSDKQDTVKLLPFHASTGLEFPLVAIPGIGRNGAEEYAADEAQLLYMAMTRATERLLLTGALAG